MERISGTLCFASRPNAVAAGMDRDQAERPAPTATPKADAAARKAAARKTAALTEMERASQDMLSEGAPVHDGAAGTRRPPS